MELQQILELLKENPEAVETLQNLQGSVSSLENKNKQILDEKKSAAQKAKELEEKIQAYQTLGKSPEEIQEIIQNTASAEELKLQEQGKFQELLEKRSKAFEEDKAALEAKNAELENIISAKDAEIWDMGVGNDTLGILSAGDTRVANPQQMLALLGKSRDPDTQGVYRGEDGKPHYRLSAIESRPLSEYISELKEAPDWKHHFLSNVGSGSGGTGGPGSKASQLENPFAKETVNITKQQEMVVSNPALASQMARAAGQTPFWE